MRGWSPLRRQSRAALRLLSLAVAIAACHSGHFMPTRIVICLSNRVPVACGLCVFSAKSQLFCDHSKRVSILPRATAIQKLIAPMSVYRLEFFFGFAMSFYFLQSKHDYTTYAALWDEIGLTTIKSFWYR